MKTLISSSATLLTAILGSSFLAACGSSGSDEGTQAPPAVELPDEFAVFVADFEFDGISRPYLFDLDTGERRSVVASLPAGRDLVGEYSYLSPDGKILALNLENTGPGERVRIVDLETGSTFTPTFPSGAKRRRGSSPADQGASSFGVTEEGDDAVGGIFSFSADSSFALIQRGFFELYLADGDGRNVSAVEVNGQPVEVLGWIGDSNRILTVSEDPTSFSTELSILDAATKTATQFTPAPGEIVYVDEVILSADSGFAVVAMEASGTPGDETEDVVAIDLSTGGTTRWTVPGLEEESIAISSDGSHVAFFAYGGDTTGFTVFLAERESGAIEVVSAPPVDPSESYAEMLAFEPGGDRLAFISNHRESDTEEITVATFGGTSISIDPTVPTNADTDEFAWSPAGRFLAYALGAGGSSQVYVYDADSVDLPFAVSDSTVVDQSNEYFWSPVGGHLLVRERRADTLAWVSSTYSAADWTLRRELGEGWREGSHAGTAENFRSVRFSPDGHRVIWRAPASSVGNALLEGLSLWSAVIDAPVGTSPTLLTGAASGSTGAVIEHFWLRSTPPVVLK